MFWHIRSFFAQFTAPKSITSCAACHRQSRQVCTPAAGEACAASQYDKVRQGAPGAHLREERRLLPGARHLLAVRAPVAQRALR